MGFASYGAYLASSWWATNQERWYAQLDEQPACYICDASANLQLHHCAYERLGAEAREDLVVLCAGCHLRVHRFVKAGECELRTAHTYLRKLRDAGIERRSPTRVLRATHRGTARRRAR